MRFHIRNLVGTGAEYLEIADSQEGISVRLQHTRSGLQRIFSVEPAEAREMAKALLAIADYLDDPARTI